MSSFLHTTRTVLGYVPSSMAHRTSGKAVQLGCSTAKWISEHCWCSPLASLLSCLSAFLHCAAWTCSEVFQWCDNTCKQDYDLYALGLFSEKCQCYCLNHRLYVNPYLQNVNYCHFY